ncbi:MAG: acetolactate synthase small subunit [Candidatus Omnitrophica bacterium]|nr:acetolactate synthase small subunit [Candidatus Omnitrophota bacterium]
MRHIISALVENKSGVLARIAGLFSARGFNIDSLTVGETEDPTVSRMTIVVRGDDRTLEQVKKQLNKLIDIISVRDLTKKGFIDRELLLFKISVGQDTRQKAANYLEKNHARVLHSTSNTLTVEFVGDQEHVLKLLEGLSDYGVKDMVRTGRIALAKE